MLIPGQQTSDAVREDLLPQLPELCDEPLPPEVRAERRITVGLGKSTDSERRLRQQWTAQASCPVTPVKWAIERIVVLLCSGPAGQDDVATCIEQAPDTAGLAIQGIDDTTSEVTTFVGAAMPDLISRCTNEPSRCAPADIGRGGY